ncbi:hypothetical protein EV183_001249 [Coemansia sp. RSA 2336]|nr:hypothetical protein EV183_001249 [Coemansia sp. RSA 2336]
MDDILQLLKQEITLDCEEGSSLDDIWGYVNVAQKRQHQQNGITSEPVVDDALKAYLWPCLLRMSEIQLVNDETVLYDASSGNADFINRPYEQISREFPLLRVRATEAAINRELFGREEGNERVMRSPVATKFLKCLARTREKGMTQVQLSRHFDVDARSTFHYIKLLDKFGLVVKYATFDHRANTNLVVLRRFSREKQPSGEPQQTENQGENENEDNAILTLIRSGVRQKISDILQATDNGYMVENDLAEAINLNVLNPKFMRYFHRVLRELNSNGFVETVLVQMPNGEPPTANQMHDADDAQPADDDNDQAAESQPAKKKRKRKATSKNGDEQDDSQAKKRQKCRPGYSYHRCVRFIKPYVNSRKVRGSMGIPLQSKDRSLEVVSDNESDHLSDDADNSSDDDIYALDFSKEKAEISSLMAKPQILVGDLAAIPFDLQILRLIALAGSRGIVVRVIQYLMGKPDYRGINRSLERLETTSIFCKDGSFPGIVTTAEQRKRNLEAPNKMLIEKVHEFFGREHRKRYFLNPLAQPLVDVLTAEFTTGDESAHMLPEEVAEARVLDEPDSSNEQTNEAVDVDANEGDADAPSEPPEAAAIDPANAEIVAKCASMDELFAEAKVRNLDVAAVVRERIILQLLEKEGVISCGQDTATRCEALVLAYYKRQRGSSISTTELETHARRHQMDKRTLVRTVENLQRQEKLKMQKVVTEPELNFQGTRRTYELAIAKDIDAGGSLVSAFVTQLRDRRAFSAHTNPTLPRHVQEDIEVQRPEGSKALPRGRVRRGFGNGHRKHHVKLRESLMGRARVMMVNIRRKPKTPWESALRQMNRPPRRAVRAMDLYSFLANIVWDKVDNEHIFANGAFRSAYLFTKLPLRMFLDMVGGVRSLPMLLPYIHEGESACNRDVAPQTDIESVRRRLDAAVGELPSQLLEMVMSRKGKSRVHLQHVLFILQMLQLIRPVRSAWDMMNLSPPPRAEEAFQRVSIEDPRILHYGYQFIGHARMLTREGYERTMDAYKRQAYVADLRYYLNDYTYDMRDPHERFRYVTDLERNSRGMENLPTDHPLSGIGSASYWKSAVRLTGNQTDDLEKYVDEENFTTPLDDIEKLCEAAAQAGVSPEDARRFYQHANARLQFKKYRRENAHERYIVWKQVVNEKRNREFREQQARAENGEMPSTDRHRIPFSEAETQLISICYTVLQHHAQEHDHVFVFKRAALELFPLRLSKTDAFESVRQHWYRIKKNPRLLKMSESMKRIWKYVLRDAVKSGELVNNPDLDEFDVVASVKHFDAAIERESLEALEAHYLQDIAEEARKERLALEDYDYVSNETWRRRSIPTVPTIRPATTSAATASDTAVATAAAAAATPIATPSAPLATPVSNTRARAAPPRATPPRIAPARIAPARIAPVRIAPAPTTPSHRPTPGLSHPKPQITRLPKTMRHLSRLIAEDKRSRGRDVAAAGFSEDVAYDSYMQYIRHEQVYTAMLTIHQGCRALADYSSPFSTQLKLPAPDAEDAGDQRSQSKQQFELICPRSDTPVYPEIVPQSSAAPRTLNIEVLKQHIRELVAGNAEASPDLAKLCLGETGYNHSSYYAMLALTRSLAINIALTPEHEYSVEIGQQVLALNNKAAMSAYLYLTRNHTLTALRPFESSVGLGGSEAGKERGTVVAYRNSGSMGADTRRLVTGGSRASGISSNEDSNDAQDAEAEDNGANAGGLSQISSRMVPGRGYGLGDKFMNMLSPTLPSEFTTLSANLPSFDHTLDPAEFHYVCALIAAGKLWLRPQYTSLGKCRLSALYGFRRTAGLNIIEFNPHLVAGRAFDVPMDAEKPTKQSSELALHIALGVVEALGPLGASATELYLLFAKLFADDAMQSVVPAAIRSELQSLSSVACILKQLEALYRVYAVGSGDLRYVSSHMYYRHWSARVSGLELGPKLGQNISGTTNMAFVQSMLLSLVSHVLDNPGISQTTLMRRFFAPHISKYELLRHLNRLVDLEIICADQVQEDADLGKNEPYPLCITYYHMSPEYRLFTLESALCQTAKRQSRPRSARRVSELRRDVASLSVDASEEKTTRQEEGERMQTRQDTNPERKLALQRLMNAIRDGDFDEDLEDTQAPLTRSKQRRALRKRRMQKNQGGDHDSDSDYVQNDEEEDEEYFSGDEEMEDEVTEKDKEDDQRLKQTEQRLILKFKTAKLATGPDQQEQAEEEGPRLEDIDWSEFDLETINEILARREALRARRRQKKLLKLGVNDSGEVTTAKLKKSSLAPPPLQLDRAHSPPHISETNGKAASVDSDDEENVIFEECQIGGRLGFDNMDIDGEEPEFRDLFEETNEPNTPGTSLHLPPRASAMSEEMLASDRDYQGASRYNRPHPALIRNMTDAHSHADKDMRIVLQYELRSEEILLKDLKAEISDKLLKLQAEEKLLRMIVKRDFELPEEESAEDQAQHIEAFPSTFEAEAGEEPRAMPMEIENAASDSEESLSGMSSSSSDDDVQNDELTRGALSQMLRTYLPNGELDQLGS